MSVLLDAFALIALLAEEPAADDVEALLRRGEAAITAVNLAEALDVLQRVQGIPRERLEALTAPLVGERMTLIAIDERIARDAADIRARRYHRTRAPLSLADCILLAATGESDALATGDGPLIRVAEAENVQVKALPR
ncbi:MAG TPA: PIN domain-containing protein [Solirubrobacteraceae bacterium]|nr:PIN domain-containing protein [Solirubrobacteraceae bacterium]